MGGDEHGELVATSPVQDQGSVGDWRLPSWMPHISGLAWLFIALAIVSVVGQVATYVSGYGWSFSLDPDRLTGAVATSLPILLPAAVLWRGEGLRPRLTSGLVIGSRAIAVGALLSSLISASDPGFDLRFGNSYIGGSYEYGGLLTLIALLGFAGPVLLGRGIRGLRGGPASRWTVGAGAALGALTVVYVLFALNYMYSFYNMFVDPNEYPGGLFFWHDSTSELVGMLSLIGWAYFAWAVISARGDGKRPRAAWQMAVVAVVIQQVLLALNVLPAAIGFVASPSGQANMLTDVAVAIYTAVFIATPALTIAGSVLLIAAFAAGLGNPGAAEPDAERIGLDPLPNPG